MKPFLIYTFFLLFLFSCGTKTAEQKGAVIEANDIELSKTNEGLDEEMNDKWLMDLLMAQFSTHPYKNCILPVMEQEAGLKDYMSYLRKGEKLTLDVEYTDDVEFVYCDDSYDDIMLIVKQAYDYFYLYPDQLPEQEIRKGDILSLTWSMKEFSDDNTVREHIPHVKLKARGKLSQFLDEGKDKVIGFKPPKRDENAMDLWLVEEEKKRILYYLANSSNPKIQEIIENKEQLTWNSHSHFVEIDGAQNNYNRVELYTDKTYTEANNNFVAVLLLSHNYQDGDCAASYEFDKKRNKLNRFTIY